jgi:signal transduction histidine kinase
VRAIPFEIFRKFWLPWTFVGLLAALCSILAIIQYGWIDQLSNAERRRLETDFQANLNQMAEEFDLRVDASYQQLKPSFAEITEWGTRAACVRQYRQWTANAEPLFRRVAIVSLDEGEPGLQSLDPAAGDFLPAAWPAAWKGMRHRFDARQAKSAVPNLPASESLLLDSTLPDSTWIIGELNLDYIRSTLLPDLIGKYLAGTGMPAYDLEIVAPGEPPATLMELGGQHDRKAPDGRVDLHPGSTARWRLSVYHRGLGLGDQVTIGRVRNIALSLGILLLILVIVVVLLHSSRRSLQLAEMQMNFVAGVSHELRTPLTVIRTAAYNLRGRMAAKPEQVEKYACLIQKESETLSAVVEQILRYGAATKGRAIGERRNLNVNRLIRDCIPANLTVEQSIDPDLPMVFGDVLALKHALQNLFDNAVKYGTEGSGWVGISARAVEVDGKRFVEIHIADRGPGIPADEQAHIFDAFFRGRRALQDQMRGTGLGLNLVKQIIEAHQGTSEVKSEAGQGTEFIVRLPAAEEELEDVFSNSPN